MHDIEEPLAELFKIHKKENLEVNYKVKNILDQYKKK